MVDTNNISGHRARLDWLLSTKPRKAAMERYVGGGARYSIGHREKEAIAKHHDLADARIIDIGCGIGRLTQALANEPVASYLGTDILPEMLDEARELVTTDSRFSFALVKDQSVPVDEGSADIICAFSVMTHLSDEQVFSYFLEAARVLHSGGTAIYSFIDFALPRHREMFLQFARKHQSDRQDVLKFFEKDTLRFFAEAAGLELIEFQDAYTASPAKFPNALLPDGKFSEDVLVLGQSLIFMRKPD